MNQVPPRRPPPPFQQEGRHEHTAARRSTLRYFALSYTVAYGIGAFAVWDLNPAHWDEFLRASLAMMATGIATICAGFQKQP